MVYGPERPYSSEKPPSMQFLIPESRNPETLGLEQQDFLHNGQSRIESTPSQNFTSRDRSALSTSPDGGETASYQPSPTNLGYYPDRDVKVESRLLPHQSPFMSEQGLDCVSPPNQYSSTLVGVSSGSSSLYFHDEGSSSGPQPHQYTGLPRGSQKGFFPGPRNEVSRQDQQSNFDILQPNQRGGKRGPFKDPGLREQTAQTRRIGSCIRCRMQRIRVGSVSPISTSEFSGCNHMWSTAFTDRGVFSASTTLTSPRALV